MLYLVPHLHPQFSFTLASHEADGHFYADDYHIYLSIANIEETKIKVLTLLSDITKVTAE